MQSRIVRFACAVAVAAVLVVPASALAADKPVAVQTWQTHLAHMRSMGPNLGAHIQDCIAMHGSMAQLLGPNGEMVDAVAAMNAMAAGGGK
jgi:hypothetical protein